MTTTAKTAFFSCRRVELSRTLARLTKTAMRTTDASRRSRPQLSAVRIDVNGTVELRTSNVDAVSEELIDESERHGNDAKCVDVWQLAKIVRLIKTKEVTVSLTDDCLRVNGLMIRYTCSASDVRGSVDDAKSESMDWEGKALLLAEMIGKVSYAADAELSGHQLSAILFEFAPDGLRLVATDGRRLAAAVSNQHDTDPAATVLIPVVFCRAVQIALKSRKDSLARIFVSKDSVIFEADGLWMQTRLVEGRFPSWRKIFSPVPDVMFCAADELATVLANCKAISENENMGIDVSCKETASKLQIDYTTENGKVSQAITACVHSDFDITLNWQFLFDFCKAAKGEIMTLSGTDCDSPCYFRHAIARAIIMPMNKT